MIIVPQKMQLGSRARVTFYDEDGVTRVPASLPDGSEFWGGYWHPNMITDAGLDLYADQEGGFGYGANTVEDRRALRYRLALDTGLPEIKDKSVNLGVQASQSGTTVTATGAFFSGGDVGKAVVFADGSSGRITSFTSATAVEVDTSQSVAQQDFERWHVDILSLVDPVNQSTSNGGFDGSADIAVTQDDWVRVRATENVVCTLGANRTITGYGFRYANSGPYAIVERFRDANGNPISISLLAGKQVRVEHEMITWFDARPQPTTLNIDEYDAADQYVRTVSLPVTLATQVPGGTGGASALGALVDPYQNRLWRVGRFSARPLVPAVTDPWVGAPSLQYDVTNASGQYVAGSRKKVIGARLTAAQLNGTYEAFSLQRSIYNLGFVIVFDSGYSFTKASTHQLFFGLEYQWDRMYVDP